MSIQMHINKVAENFIENTKTLECIVIEITDKNLKPT